MCFRSRTCMACTSSRWTTTDWGSPASLQLTRYGTVPVPVRCGTLPVRYPLRYTDKPGYSRLTLSCVFFFIKYATIVITASINFFPQTSRWPSFSGLVARTFYFNLRDARRVLTCLYANLVKSLCLLMLKDLPVLALEQLLQNWSGLYLGITSQKKKICKWYFPVYFRGNFS